jgi:hypothetical protein
MNRIELTGAERQVLAETLKTGDDPRLRERYRAILMAGNGRCPYRIAQDLRLRRESVVVWIRDYQDRGPEGLKIHPAPGQAGPCLNTRTQ